MNVQTLVLSSMELLGSRFDMEKVWREWVDEGVHLGLWELEAGQGIFGRMSLVYKISLAAAREHLSATIELPLPKLLHNCFNLQEIVSLGQSTGQCDSKRGSLERTEGIMAG
jgi:hypothetical protein